MEFPTRDRQVEHILWDILYELRQIHKELARPVASFKIIGDDMNINPGQSTVLTAVPLDASGAPTVLPAGDVPNWSASDVSQISVTPSADGLSLSVTVNATATASTVVFTITDGKITTATGTFSLTITPVTPPPNPVASFSITGSTPK